MNVEIIFLVYIAFVVALLTPGANIMFLLEKSMTAGRGGALAVSAGLALGSLTWSATSTITVFASYSVSPTVSAMVGVMGGMYLVSLSIRRVRSGLRVDLSAPEGQPSGVTQTLISAYLIMVSNPKAFFAWVGIVSTLSLSGAKPVDYLAIVVGTFAISFSAHALLGILFSSAAMRIFYQKAIVSLNLVFVLVYALLGLFLILYSLRTLELIA